MNDAIRKAAEEVKRLRARQNPHDGGHMNMRAWEEQSTELQEAEKHLCDLVLEAPNIIYDAVTLLRVIALNLPDVEPKFESRENWYGLVYAAWVAGEKTRAFLAALESEDNHDIP